MILNVTFEQITADIQVQFDEADDFSVSFGELNEIPPEELPTYEGEHQIIPSFADQILDTSGLMMAEDIQIEPIPVARVSNNSGGITVTIGG